MIYSLFIFLSFNFLIHIFSSSFWLSPKSKILFQFSFNSLTLTVTFFFPSQSTFFYITLTLTPNSCLLAQFSNRHLEHGGTEEKLQNIRGFEISKLMKVWSIMFLKMRMNIMFLYMQIHTVMHIVISVITFFSTVVFLWVCVHLNYLQHSSMSPVTVRRSLLDTDN